MYVLTLRAWSLLSMFASVALVVPLYIDTSVSIWGTVREGMKQKRLSANQTDVSSNVREQKTAESSSTIFQLRRTFSVT